MLNRREYVGDVQPISFAVEYDPCNEDEPWVVETEDTHDMHETLDEVLFWELVLGGRIISEEMRQRINKEWETVHAK